MAQYILILLTIMLQEQRGIGDIIKDNATILLYTVAI